MTSDIVSIIKKIQNLQEAQHIEDTDTVLKELTCIRSDIKSAKRTTEEDIRTINYEHTSCSFDEERRLKRKHANAIFDKHYFITKVWKVEKEKNANARDLEK